MRVRLKRERLLALLAASPLSQNHWALKLGLSRGHWSDLVNGKHPYPSAKTRARMLEVFGVDLQALFVIEDGSTPWPDVDFRAAIAGRYLIDAELGQGGMGAVYLARDVRHGRPVALKVISPEAVSGIGLTQFLREISTIAHLQHPHILPLFDSGELLGYPFYVMPWIRGGSLRRRLETNPRLSLEETLRVTRDIASALSYAHGQGVLHCDIKPENILLDDDHAYVMDFGVSRALHREVGEWGRQAVLDLSAGTPAYVSPELARGDQTVDGRSDLYSLACVVFEMLSGRPPFQGGSTETIVAGRFRDSAPALNASVPAAVRAVVARAMAVDPDRRPSTPAQFVSDLTHAASALPARRSVSIVRTLGRFWFSIQRGRMSAFFDDLKSGLRSLRKQPGFAATILGIQTVALAANTAVFSLADAVVFRPLPYRDESALVQVWGADGETRFGVSERERVAYRTEPGLFAGIGTWLDDLVTLGGDQRPEQIRAGRFDEGLLGVLGVAPIVGRAFSPDEDTPGKDDVVLLSHALWRTRFAGDPAIIGRTLTIDGRPRSIVGVLPPDFRLPTGFLGPGAQLYLPLALDPTPDPRNFHFLNVVARLRPGADLALTGATLRALGARLAAEIPMLPRAFAPIAVPLHEQVMGDSRNVSLLLLGAVGLMLLVAATNVAGLVAARSEGRQRELAVRSALGASRGRLVRQFLTESLIVGVAGGALGLIVAVPLVRGLSVVAASRLPRAGSTGISWLATGLTLAVAILAAAVAGLISALTASRRDVVTSLRDGSRTATGGRERTGVRRGLLVAEIALAVTLAAGAGLMIRTWRNVLASDPGFSNDGALALQISLPPDPRADRGSSWRFYRSLVDRVRELPGVRAAGVTRELPLVTRTGDWGFYIAGRPGAAAGERNPRGDWHVISDGYFEAIGIPPIEGRTFTPADDTSRAGVVVINQALARQYWPGQSPLGASIKMSSNVDTLWRTVIGVVGDVRSTSLEREPVPEYFLPYTQFPRTNGLPASTLHLVVRGAVPGAELTRAVEGVVRELAPDVAVTETGSMAEVLHSARAPRRLQFLLMTGFAMAAIGLVAVGVYGVTSQLVGLRIREFGIRLALGAKAGAVRALVVRSQLSLAVAGLGLGLLGAFALAQAMRSVLFQVSPWDLRAFALAATSVVAVVLAACLGPAARAARAQVLDVLRSD